MEGKYVIVRSNGSGCWAGTLQKRDGAEVILTDARRLWYWSGAASLSELAMKGTSKPNQCKFPMPVNEVLVMNVIEIIPTQKKAEESIREVRAWTEH